jgi:hypothetical protein
MNQFMNQRRKVVFVFTIFLVSCSSQVKKEPIIIEAKVEVKEIEKPEPKPIEVHYYLVACADTLNWLQGLKEGDTLNALLYINRVDEMYLTQQDTLVFPDTISSNLALYSPFPENLEKLNSVNKMIFISYYAQAFGVYEKGKLIRWGPVSLGKESTQTPKGLFYTNWKSKKTYSTIDSSWVMEWYFNFANYDGVSLHQYTLPGYPASHACARMFREDAYWFYYWADQWLLASNQSVAAYGTPLIVYGDYTFQGRKPWLKQDQNRLALYQREELLNQSISEHLALIIERQTVREEIEKAREAEKQNLP